VYDAEWRKRKINLFNVLRSFVSQLSPGQDLTKVSLPSELCHPFSMLELIGYRELQLFHLAFEINKYEDPLDRFMAIVKWYMGMVREETIEKKPFNPVIGEEHLCWVEHEDGDITEFIGEQVSHHPPIAAFITRNKKHGLQLSGQVTFRVAFGTNYASVNTGGEIVIQTAKEKYQMSKCMPNMMVNNVIWGEKYLMWEGAVTITCVETGFSSRIVLKEEDHRNVISGQIFDKDNTVIYEISGVAGKQAFIEKPGGEKTELIDVSSCVENKIYYLPTAAQKPFSTLNVWVPVKDAIIKNDMPVADEEKKKIEADQRVRQAAKKAAGEMEKGNYFDFVQSSTPTLTTDTTTTTTTTTTDESQHNEENPEEHHAPAAHDIGGVWLFKDNFSIDDDFVQKMKEYEKEENIKKELLEASKANTEEQVAGDASCLIQ